MLTICGISVIEMKAVLHVNNMAHQKQHVRYMEQGFDRHGVKHQLAPYNQFVEGDFAVVWGVKQRIVFDRCAEKGMPVLVMERGHLQDRFFYTSLGWGGLGRRAVYPGPDVCGDRWAKHWGQMEPWHGDGGTVLVIGQCDGDASLWGVDFRRWANSLTGAYAEFGCKVVYRPHPLMARCGNLWAPSGATCSKAETMAEDLAQAAVCVTYNSTAGVEAVLAGIPTITCDEGAMAWAVTEHEIGKPPPRPDRQPWAEWLACCQWSAAEICSGEAWAAVREVL